ncbi:hypothetical protein BDV93DRAFT_562443 [Ceratobasidium sp. AG-I]|nr:hypothetical protein BDV93DRAFT_562443 [Ceratobasidium sp. AG-I]
MLQSYLYERDFEPNIRGSRNLLDLAFSSSKPPRFLFSSSITVAGFGKPSRPLKDGYLEPEDVLNGLGYGQSKFVAEMLLRSARDAGLETCVSDWIPSVIASPASTRCLPAAIGEVSWLPLDIAARSMVDTTVARGALLPPVINSFHPRPIQWTHIINLFEEVLKSRAGSNQAFSIVPFREWNERVACAASAVEEPKRNNHKRFPSTRIQHVIDKIIFWIAARKD